MLPKNKLGKAMAKKLKVYADGEHPHSAQRPENHTLTPRRSKHAEAKQKQNQPKQDS
jgi:ribosomal protein L13